VSRGRCPSVAGSFGRETFKRRPTLGRRPFLYEKRAACLVDRNTAYGRFLAIQVASKQKVLSAHLLGF
jgi:hypothetical protein